MSTHHDGAIMVKPYNNTSMVYRQKLGDAFVAGLLEDKTPQEISAISKNIDDVYPVGWIYVIWLVDTHYYKIGQTSVSVQSRVKDFQSKCAYKSKLLLTAETAFPVQIELDLHNKFANDRCHKLDGVRSKEVFKLYPPQIMRLYDMMEPGKMFMLELPYIALG